MDKKCALPRQTMLRLPEYLRYVKAKKAEGYLNISAAQAAKETGRHPVQVRKDLSLVTGGAGRPRAGFDAQELIDALEKRLGFDNVSDAVIVGAGRLGRTLMSYEGFNNYGLNIVAAFDNKISGTAGSKPVLDMSKLENLIKRMGIKIGIITVPKENAQEVCDILVNSGILAIWNFAPVHLKVPQGIAVKNEDMAASLAELSEKLKTCGINL